ncbi:hypothetical protein Pta02_43940 [Planobispora takensis]|uniref:Uncharacterized protein n=1 Tax=Planobispora takensis TaxID=1367882 RepID=A0A8J3T0X3_9ACTN|nr:hypothetical protein Pta02_43940 [Planobispora takensis]
MRGPPAWRCRLLAGPPVSGRSWGAELLGMVGLSADGVTGGRDLPGRTDLPPSPGESARSNTKNLDFLLRFCILYSGKGNASIGAGRGSVRCYRGKLRALSVP